MLERLRPELDELGIALDWSPIDLVGITAWRRGEPFGPERTRNLERLSRELGVPVAMPTHWMDSRAAMAVAVGLGGARAGDEARWRDAVWSWVYQDARSLDEPGALDAIASRAAVAAGAPDARGLEEIERRTATAHAAGVRGVPTFLLDAWPVGIGIQEQETMLDFLRRFAAEEARRARAELISRIAAAGPRTGRRQPGGRPADGGRGRSGAVVYSDSAVSGPSPSSSNAIAGRLHVGTAASGDLRWALADLTPLVEEARLLRDLSPLAAIGFGQLLTAAVLLTRLVSKDPLRLVLEVRGDGPLGHVRAEADTHGRVRGLVERNLAERARAPIVAGGDGAGAERASPDLGTGTLRVVRQMRKQNYESRVSLVEGGVARNVVHFLEQSEQIRSAVMLGVLTRPAGVVVGGGLIVEALPGADRALVRGLEARIAQLPSISGLLEDGGPWGAARSRPRRGRARDARGAPAHPHLRLRSRALPRPPARAGGARARAPRRRSRARGAVQLLRGGVPLPGRRSAHCAMTRREPVTDARRSPATAAGNEEQRNTGTRSRARCGSSGRTRSIA